MSSTRFFALDALRGLAIALMILVNTPGSWQHVYGPLLHARWHGFTFADIVFPAFLFVVGSAMFYSLRQASFNRITLLRITKRTLMLLLIGILLNWFPFTASLNELRLPGVLQRIALCYGLAACLVLLITPRQIPFVSAVILLLYWLGLLLFAPGDPFSLAGNAVRQLDLSVLGAAHMYQGFGIAFDPEGILSTLPAVVSVLIGYYVAATLALYSPKHALRWLVKAALLLIVTAWCVSLVWPVNKALWTGSYVLLSSGLLMILLAILIWVTDIQHWRAMVQPLIVYGSNPLFIYILAWLWAVTASVIPLADSNLYHYSFTLLAGLMPAKLASLFFAFLHVILFWAVAQALYRRNLFIRL